MTASERYRKSPTRGEMAMRAGILASCGFDMGDPVVAKTVQM